MERNNKKEKTLEEYLQLAAVVLHSVVGALAFGYMFLFVALLFTRFYYVTVLYICWFIYDHFIADSSRNSGRRSSAMTKLSFWRYYANYFPVHLHKTVDLDPVGNYIFAGHPHGLVGSGYLGSLGTDGCGFSKLFPGITIHGLMMSYIFQMPVIRELYLIFGGCSVDEGSFVNHLKMGPGHSVFVVPGGSREAVLTQPGEYITFLKNRKGFIRLALKTGAAVVPAIFFGEVNTLDIASKGPWYLKVEAFFDWLTSGNKNSDFHRTLFFSRIRGRFNFTIPFRVPINHVVGAPMKFDREKLIEKYSTDQEMIDVCHQQYMEALKKLFDDHKARFGEGEKELIIV